MAKTHHRRRHRRANRTRRGGGPKKMTPEQWAKSLLSAKGKAGIAKTKSYAKPQSDAGDISRPARAHSRVSSTLD